MESLGEVFKILGKLVKFLFILCIIFVPLGLWKFIELIIWLIKHIKII